MRNDFCVIIPSYKRYEKLITLKALKRAIKDEKGYEVVQGKGKVTGKL